MSYQGLRTSNIELRRSLQGSNRHKGSLGTSNRTDRGYAACVLTSTDVKDSAE